MGKIAIEGIDIFAYHGVYPIERESGNQFLIDLYMDTDLTTAAKSDELGDTIDYHRVYQLVLAEMEAPANLLETLVYRIGHALLQHYPQIKRLTVRVRKLTPHAMSHCRESFVEETFENKQT